ncbi:hypothetical protein BGW38_008474 [Lunasporangiospora selenospora]|uniref:F-box domain-containing protein n=1 Tax=Lunasporangiospora selenospora TaxID=979761 RepID=A0A9P6FXV9_9FUNG|nr:hypothetical protein BGW38_008474 [Lunasporangiospora selenospora]
MDSPIGHNASSHTHHAVLIPELAFEIQHHLTPRDLAVAARVCQAWFDAWTPFLYHSVRYTRCPPLGNHHHHLLQHQHRPQHQRTRSLSFGRMETIPTPVYDRSGLQPQAFVPPFLNLDRYGHWIRSLECSHLFVYSCPSATPPSSLSISPPAASSSSSSLYSTANSSSVSTSSSSPLSSPPIPLVMDHLAQIQTCSSLHLTVFDLSRTAMSLERLDSLLGSLSGLRVFKFEIVNKMDGSGFGGSGSFGFGGSFGGSSGSHPIVRGYLQQHQGHMHMKPKKQTLEGQEHEVIHVIAKRLSRHLERLELSLTAPARIAVSAFQELLDSCGHLKTLSLTRVEICEVDHGRDLSSGYHSEISALLASLMSTTAASTSSPSSSSRPSGSFLHAGISASTSSSSLASTYSTSASSVSSLQSRYREKMAAVEPVLESLALHSCTIQDKECEWLMKRIPGLRELTLHDCRQLNRAAVESILRHTPRLESLALSSVPNLCRQGLEQLFFTTTVSTNQGTGESSTSSSAEQDTDNTIRIGFRLKSIRLAYLQQLDDRIMETLASHQGSTLERLSLQWCPHVTNAGIAPIFRHCERLQDLSLCLSKPTLAIFRDMDAPDTLDQDADTAKATPWACAKTLERLEIGGPMFLERVRLSNEHLHPQLYHHLSPNPHHTRSRSVPSSISMGIHSRSRSGSGSGNSAGTGGNPNIIHNAYSVAHHAGYPMYHLLRYPRLSSPFKEMQAQLETLPRLTHLGIPAKGIEHCIKRGFGDKLRIQSLSLLNQQGRVWDAVEVQELLQNMPYLRRLYCERNTIQMDTIRTLSPVRNMILQKQQQEDMQRVLQRNGVELVQYSTGGGFVES